MAFTLLVQELKRHQMSWVDDALKSETSDPEVRAVKRDSVICATAEGSLFALHQHGRWLAMYVSNEATPRNAADTVQTFLRHVAEGAEINAGLIIDVDLICSRRRLSAGIKSLGFIKELSMALKPANPGDTYREARERMRELAAERRLEIYETQEQAGLNVSDLELYKIGSEVEKGGMSVSAQSTNGGRWESDGDPEEYEVKDSGGPREVVELLALLFALAWLMQNWPWHGETGLL
ncbi:hypothetical protein [Streptomyces durhamensis]|uniref:hypothetical protein n=1 Tax=Streptomyces durhamensis TaxID=68194 RepID=UPI001ADF7167|nr:hypothetical protein [Streptomyces durhamensis]